MLGVANGHYPELVPATSPPQNISLRSDLILSSNLLFVPGGSCPRDFATKIRFSFLVSYPSYMFNPSEYFDFTSLEILGEMRNSGSCSLYNILDCLLTVCFLGPHVFVSTFFFIYLQFILLPQYISHSQRKYITNIELITS
jgi:hypothetical protein